MASKIQVLYEDVSDISGKIKVRQYYDVRELYVNGVKQSMWSDNPDRFKGTYWEGVLKVPLPENMIEPKILMLGTGAGTIPKLYSQKYTHSQITCIEIDPKIITAANDYFDLNTYQNIQVVINDANKWLEMNEQKFSHHFDIICLDTYISDSFNFNTKNIGKIQQIVKFLTSKGTLITNRIYTNENRKELTTYKKELSQYFLTVDEIIIEGFSGCDNIIIFAQSPHK